MMVFLKGEHLYLSSKYSSGSSNCVIQHDRNRIEYGNCDVSIYWSSHCIILVGMISSSSVASHPVLDEIHCIFSFYELMLLRAGFQVRQHGIP